MHSEPNYSLPWQRKRQFSSTSSGFVISDRRILTNAHSVDHHTQASHHLYQLCDQQLCVCSTLQRQNLLASMPQEMCSALL